MAYRENAPGCEPRHNLIPVWDGAPQGWRRYRDDVEIWALGTNLEVNYRVAARLVSRLRGAARHVGLRIPRDQLQPLPAVAEVRDDDGNIVEEAQPADDMRGINNVLGALEAALGGKYVTRRGETMADFFRSAHYNRRPGERMMDYVARFEEGVQKFDDDGVRFADQHDILGWWFLEKCCLSAERRERVVSQLPDDKYAYRDIKTIAIWIFPDLQITEARRSLPQRPHQQRGHRWFPAGSGSGARGVNATEHEELHGGDDQEFCDELGEYDKYGEDGHEVNEVKISEIQGFVRQELEALTTELEDAEVDLSADQTAALEEAALQVSQLPEALGVVRDARGRIQERDGGGKSTGKSRGRSAGRGAAGPGRGPQGGSGKGRELAEKLKQRKPKPTCKACGLQGHWAGDPECKAPRATMVTAGDDSDSGHDAMAVEQVTGKKLFEKQVLRNELVHMVNDHLRGVVDSACVVSVMGDVWWEAYFGALKAIGIDDLVEREQIDEKVRACVVKSEKLNLQLGRDFLEAIGSGIDVARRMLTVRTGSQPLLGSENSRFALELKPEKYKAFAIAATTRCAKAGGNNKESQEIDQTTGASAKVSFIEHTEPESEPKDTNDTWATQSTKPSKPGTMVEYCCELGRLTAEVWTAAGGKAHRLGCQADDLRRREHSKRAGDLLETFARAGGGRADVLWGSPPCSPWTALQNFMKNNARLAIDQGESRHMIKLFIVEAKRAPEVGATVTFERPVNCNGWNEPEILQLKRLLLFECVLDDCACGLENGQTDKSVRKPWKGFLRGIADVNYTLVTLQNDPEGEGIGKEPRDILATLEPEHRCVEVRYRICAGPQLPYLHQAGFALGHGGIFAEGSLKEFGDCLAIDTFELADAQGGSKAMLDSWSLTLGGPNSVIADMGGEFEREVKDELECMGSRIVSSASYSPTQNAICEMHGQTWKAHARAQISDLVLTFKKDDQITWMTAAIDYAVNSAVGRSVAALEANHKIGEAFLAKNRAATTALAAATYQ
ncbi:unnamed protein product, partial [Prorocentrum cordatum]